MIASDKKKAGTINSKRYIWGLIIAWTVIIAASLLWNVFQARKETLATAHVQALVAYQKDVIYRRWSTMHGGVYVPVTEKTQPNPFLADIPERDIRTTSGIMLTLMNPAYMTRQAYELGLKEYGVRAHITSLRPIRSENAPDSWEIKALQAFEHGEKEIYSVETIEDQKYFRLMSPLITEKGCLLCHARHGYKENDIRGGISVSIPMEPLWAISRVQLIRMALIHAVLWLIGIAAIAFGTFQFRESEQRRSQAEEALKKANEELEKQVQVRTAELVKINKALQQDITERKRAEEALSESEERFRAILSNTPDHILMQDNELRYTFVVNPQLGLTEQDMIGKTDYDFLSKEEGDKLTKVKRQVIETGEPLHFETSLISREGNPEFFDGTYVPKCDAQGKIDGLIGYFRNVTERKKTEEMLQKEKEKAQTYLDIAGVIMVAIDADQKVTLLNKRGCEVLGYTAHEIIGKNWFDTFLPEWDRERVKTVFDQLMAGKIEPVEYFENLVLIRDGEEKIIAWHNTVLRDEDGNIVGTLSSGEDITERKQAEEALWESEEKFSKAFHSNPAMLVLTTLDGKNLDVNQAYADFLGYSREEILGKNVVNLQIVSVEERQKILELIQRGGGSVHNAEIVVRVRDGSLRHILFSADVISLGSVPHRLTTLLDITERKKAEEERRIINEELLAINRIITTTTTTTTTGVKGILEKVLDEALYITGLEGGTICMVTPDETLNLAVHRETSEATILDLTTNQIKIGECLCGECARDHKPLILWDREAVLKFSSREAQRGEDIRFHAALPLITGGRCVGVLCVFTRTDKKPFERRLKLLETITSQIAIALENARLYEETTLHAAILEDRVKERTAELSDSQGALMNLVEDLNIKSSEIEKANLRLQELDQLKSMFIASMSHELRTPLNSIIGFTGILLQGMAGELNDEQQDQLRRVQASGKHLLELINDVIDISKIEAGKLQTYVSEFSLATVIDQAVAALKGEIAHKGLDLEIGLPEDVTLNTDRRRLLQCVLNLLSNAVKYTEKGAVRLSARVKSEDEGLGTRDEKSSIEISVADTGIGIREEDLPLLFAPFTRLESPLKVKNPGTGLGLYLTKKITVELLGGSVVAQSKPGVGSTFTLIIPKTLSGGEIK